MSPYWRIWRLKKKKKIIKGFQEEGESRIMRTEVFFLFPEIGAGMQGLYPWMMTSKVGSLLGQVTHTALASGLYLIFHC